MVTMMKCGHAANGVNSHTGEPVCVLCVGLHSGADVVDNSPFGVEGRTMSCTYLPTGHADRPSDPNSAFFNYRPEKRTDLYYCGCKGWD